MKRTLLLIFTLITVSNAIADVGLIMPDLSGQTGAQVTVPVKVTNFQNILAIQGTIQFDPAIVSYASVQDFGLPGMSMASFGTSGTATGKLSFAWNDPTLTGVTLADSSVLFTITFNIVGTNAQVSNLDFVNSPTPIEVIDDGFNVVPTELNNGSITVQNPPAATVTLFMDNASDMVGAQMNISMKAVDFNDIASVQGTIQFDPAALTFNSVSYFGLPGMSAANFGTSQAATGKITFTWFDMSTLGVDMADSTALFTLTFTHSCTPGTTSIDIVNNPTAVEVVDATFSTLPTTLVSGSVTATPLSVSAMAISPTICEGASTTLTASGATTYAWLPTDSLNMATGSSVTANPSATTIYTVTGTSLGCDAAATVTVTVDPLPDAGYSYTDDGNGSYTFTNTSVNAASFAWDFGDSNISSLSPATHTYAANGTYTVVIAATNPCGTDGDTLVLNVTSVPTVSLKAVSADAAIRVYPNPNNGAFNIKYDAAADQYTVQVVNALGQTVFTKECKDTPNHLISFDLSAFENGMYFIQIDDQNEVLNSRIIINK